MDPRIKEFLRSRRLNGGYAEQPQQEPLSLEEPELEILLVLPDQSLSLKGAISKNIRNIKTEYEYEQDWMVKLSKLDLINRSGYDRIKRTDLGREIAFQYEQDKQKGISRLPTIE